MSVLPRWFPLVSLLVTALPAAAGTPAAPAPRVRVAIVPGVAVNLDAARVDALGQDLAEALAAELDVDVVGGLEVRRQLPAEGLPPDCVTVAACAADVAQRTGAQQLLFVVMVDSGAAGSIEIDVTWIEPASGHSASRPAIDVMSAADAKSRFALSAHLLLPDARVRVKPNTGDGAIHVDTKLTGGTPRHFTTLSKITGGIAIAGTTASILLGIATRSKYTACDDDPACVAGDPRRDTIRHFGLAADASLVVGIGAAITTLALYATSREGPHVVVGPAAEGTGATLAAFGRF